jgi:hypothetical protein
VVCDGDARNAYGYRNTDSQRRRTRLATTRRGRGCLEPRSSTLKLDESQSGLDWVGAGPRG